MKLEKLKSRIKFSLRVIWIIFIGIIVSLGVNQLIYAWGFRENSWFAGIGALIAIYTMVVVWNTDHRKVFNL